MPTPTYAYSTRVVMQKATCVYRVVSGWQTFLEAIMVGLDTVDLFACAVMSRLNW